MHVDKEQDTITMPLTDYLDEVEQRYNDGAANANYEIEALRVLVYRMSRHAAGSTIMAAIMTAVAIICGIGWWTK